MTERTDYRRAQAPTQVAYPGRAVVRTIAVVLPVLAALLLAIPEVVTVIDEEAGAHLPDSLRAWLAGLATAAAILTAIGTRVLALASVTRLLERSRLLGWLAPAPVPPEPPTPVTVDELDRAESADTKAAAAYHPED